MFEAALVSKCPQGMQPGHCKTQCRPCTALPASAALLWNPQSECASCSPTREREGAVLHTSKPPPEAELHVMLQPVVDADSLLGMLARICPHHGPFPVYGVLVAMAVQSTPIRTLHMIPIQF
jgi:hypothetical protein